MLSGGGGGGGGDVPYNGDQSYGDQSYGDQAAGGYGNQSGYVDNTGEWDDTPNSYYQQDNQPPPFNRGTVHVQINGSYT